MRRDWTHCAANTPILALATIVSPWKWGQYPAGSDVFANGGLQRWSDDAVDLRFVEDGEHYGAGCLISGSMGTASYVVQGLGNALALNSSPHGAGREYSRTRARASFTIDDLRASMVGIEYRDSAAFIDEIPAAYKDIDQVMTDASDLVESRHTLHQLVNVKGD